MANEALQKIQTEETLERINNGINAANEAQGIIDLAKQAGFDVAQFEKANTETKNKLLRIKQAFFPGR